MGGKGEIQMFTCFIFETGEYVYFFLLDSQVEL